MHRTQKKGKQIGSVHGPSLSPIRRPEWPVPACTNICPVSPTQWWLDPYVLFAPCSICCSLRPLSAGPVHRLCSSSARRRMRVAPVHASARRRIRLQGAHQSWPRNHLCPTTALRGREQIKRCAATCSCARTSHQCIACRGA